MTENWKGNCYAIATKLVRAKLVAGSAVYGHWTGPIAPGSYFAHFGRVLFVRHGWILMPDGQVCDPTRWVFEGAEPYLYVGPPDHYDEGAQTLAEAMWNDRPPPAPQGERLPVSVDGVAGVWLRNLFGVKTRETLLANNQLHYLANMPYARITAAVGRAGLRAVYEVIAARADYAIAWIPTDNVERARRECGFEVPP